MCQTPMRLLGLTVALFFCGVAAGAAENPSELFTAENPAERPTPTDDAEISAIAVAPMSFASGNPPTSRW